MVGCRNLSGRSPWARSEPGPKPQLDLLGHIDEALRPVPEKLERDRAVAHRVLAREAACEMKPDAEAAAVRLDGDRRSSSRSASARDFARGVRARSIVCFRKVSVRGVVGPIGPGRARHGNMLLVDKGQTGATIPRMAIASEFDLKRTCPSRHPFVASPAASPKWKATLLGQQVGEGIGPALDAVE
jgi:hypothetical protein